ncbi:MAG: hypothetical protein K5978_07790 [Campylobacter sp.]|nr:hypothetical protein [Campylobacter sp.]
MRQKLAILLVFILALGGYFLYKKMSVSYDDPPEFSSIDYNKLTPLPCDLSKRACVVEFKDKNVSFELEPKEVYPMKPFTLKISGIQLENPSLEIYGLNMDMGIIRAKAKSFQNTITSQIVLSICIIDIMRYRFDVLENGKKTGLFVDFDLSR